LEGLQESFEGVKVLVRIAEERTGCEKSKCLLLVLENGEWTQM